MLSRRTVSQQLLSFLLVLRTVSESVDVDEYAGLFDNISTGTARIAGVSLVRDVGLCMLHETESVENSSHSYSLCAANRHESGFV